MRKNVVEVKFSFFDLMGCIKVYKIVSRKCRIPKKIRKCKEFSRIFRDRIVNEWEIGRLREKGVEVIILP